MKSTFKKLTLGLLNKKSHSFQNAAAAIIRVGGDGDTSLIYKSCHNNNGKKQDFTVKYCLCYPPLYLYTNKLLQKSVDNK